jgi:1,4-alpha-glucan branching enzyme
MCYIVGAFNNWDVTNAPLMTKVDDTRYTITLDNVTKASEYKYTCGQSWDYVELKDNRTWS